MKRFFITLLLSIAMSSVIQANTPVPDKKNPLKNYPHTVVLEWNAIALETMQGPNYNPLLASRIFAMVHLGIHDALNNITPVYETYTLARVDSKADPIAAAAVAAHTVLVGSFPDKKAQLDEALARSLKNVKSGSARERGIALGELAGKAILNKRSKDDAFADPVGKVTNPEQPGLYQATPPMPFLFAPTWDKMETFGIQSPSQFRVAPMPSLKSKEYTLAFNEVKTKGSKANSTRTAEETTIAKYWYEFSEIGWNRVTAVAVKDANLDLLATARLFALVNMGLADSYTAGWDSKLHYNFWRPYTAIRKASNDGNDQTEENPTWEPLLGTPPIHDYPSTHSVLGNAAAVILTQVLGKNVGFTMTSTSAEPAGYTRTFKTFAEAAVENADSRVYAGLHFRFSCTAGLDLGKNIGDYIVAEKLKRKSNSKNL